MNSKVKIKSYTLKFSILLILLLLLFLTDILVGSEIFSLSEIKNNWFNTNTAIHAIIFNFRLPRAITAILAGAALSLSGLLMQTIFRNPLAGPYILGISSGAGLGVALVVLAGIGSSSIFIQNFGIITASWFGSLMVLMLILVVSLKVKDIMTLLVLGILFGSGISALVNILQYFSNNAELKTFVLWTMGSLENINKQKLIILSFSILPVIFLSFLSVKSLNALILGEIYAKSMGVNITTSRLFVFITTGILTGTVTAFCGPIGFIGIIIPHLTRLLFSTSNHFWLIPGSVLLGADILLFSDILSQVPGSEIRLPINSVTALFGVPIIIWLIIRNKRISV